MRLFYSVELKVMGLGGDGVIGRFIFAMNTIFYALTLYSISFIPFPLLCNLIAGSLRERRRSALRLDGYGWTGDWCIVCRMALRALAGGQAPAEDGRWVGEDEYGGLDRGLGFRGPLCGVALHAEVEEGGNLFPVDVYVYDKEAYAAQ